MTIEEAKKVEKGTPVLCRYGHNKVLDKPFEFLYDFGYVGQTGKIIVYKHGERNMQDSFAMNPESVSLATEEDMKENYWGS